MEDLGHGQKPVVMPNYPHMLAQDREVWTKFLKSDFIKIERVWYDVRVGLPVFLGVGADDRDTRIAEGLTRKRIDVVAQIGGGFWIIEVKPEANMYAIGQVIIYTRLFVKEFGLSGEIVSVIICDAFDEDVLDELDDLEVLVICNN